MFVIDKATGKPVHLTRFAAANPFSNYIAISGDEETTSKSSYETANGTAIVDAESRALVAHISRSILAQAFTMCMLIVNWTLAVGTVYTTIAMLVREEKMNDAVLALPITVVLTIPDSLRFDFFSLVPFHLISSYVRLSTMASSGSSHISPFSPQT